MIAPLRIRGFNRSVRPVLRASVILSTCTYLDTFWAHAFHRSARGSVLAAGRRLLPHVFDYLAAKVQGVDEQLSASTEASKLRVRSAAVSLVDGCRRPMAEDYAR